MGKRRFTGVCLALMMVLNLLGTTMPVAASGNEGQTQEVYEAMNAMELTAAMQPGWNMGNTLDATGGETSWGNPMATRELLAAIREAGFKSIRIPVTWQHSIGGSPAYTIDAAYMARVHEVVDWALDLGFIVMLNMHHDSSWLHDMPSRGDLLLDRFAKVWEQISESFKDYPTTLIFETINEPRFSDDWGLETDEYFEIVDQLNNTAYEIIRASASKNTERKVVMETLVAGITQTKVNRLKANILSHEDPNLIASVHYYGHYHFSMNIAGKTSFDAEVQRDIDQQMQILHDTLVADNIPVILGEYGLLGFDDSTGVIQQGEKLKFFDYLVSKADELGVTTMLWDNGQHFERNEHYWRDPALHATIIQAVGARSSYTEHDTSYIPVDAITDLSVGLTLNGNDLVEIVDNLGRTWIVGEDYELDQAAELLVLKADSLQALTGGVIGRDSSLTLKFSSGPDWQQHLFVIGEASLKEAEVTTHGFSIPVDLQADQVRAIVAVSKTGGSLANQSWTQYLTFSSDYTVNYENESIDISATVMTRTNDFAYLTVEFWSGLSLPYSITKADGVMLGVPSTTAAEITPQPIETEPVETSDDVEPTEAETTETPANTETPETTDEDAVTGEPAEGKMNRGLLVGGIVAAVAAVGAVGAFIARRLRRKQND